MSTPMSALTRHVPLAYLPAPTLCVHIEKFCDGTPDRSDLSDEANCMCDTSQFQCKSGLCIARQFRCDRDMDCPDWDDEVGCNMTCDNLEMFPYEEDVVPCNTTSQCILSSWKCDGNKDCWDGSDENYCDNSSKDGACDDGGFRCKSSGACIPHQWECDTDNDCGDNSDEKQCNYTCESHMFQCNLSKLCLPRSWECDGHSDCANYSDEGDHCSKLNILQILAFYFIGPLKLSKCLAVSASAYLSRGTIAVTCHHESSPRIFKAASPRPIVITVIRHVTMIRGDRFIADLQSGRSSADRGSTVLECHGLSVTLAKITWDMCSVGRR
ncbi:very low-density lipoprotein receptor-like [Argopecten irradians]|uniref:very low-density lipoprotein receptor-like n=1 Tax=Argopecten irradians TaxID=31199 RepID=UPI003718D98E